MKRKHSEDTSVPDATSSETQTSAEVTTNSETTIVTESTTVTETTKVTENKVVEHEATSFQSLGLDARLLQGIAKLGFSEPTAVQAKAVALALDGKDILGMLPC